MPSYAHPRLLSGFALLRPVAVAACGYAVAAVVWLALGDRLPGGRWFAVHLFTIGILTNLVVALTEHFGRTLLQAGAPGQRLSRFIVLNVGAVMMLGFPPDLRYPFVLGAAMLAGTVLWLLVELRRMRRGALEARFAFAVRAYEHACVAFVVGALLGALLGTGVVSGRWYGAGRLVHMHVNVLGWGGLTLLATVVFLGPAMMRTRMHPTADRWARGALRLAPISLTLAVVGMLMRAGTEPTVAWPDLLAGTGLLLFAVAAGLVVVPLLRAGRKARPSAQAWMIQAAGIWFVAVVATDAVAIATGRRYLLDGLGAALIVCVLGQAMLAALNHLAPMVWSSAERSRAMVRTNAATWLGFRVIALNLGGAAVLLAAVLGRQAGPTGAAIARTGWTVVAVVVLLQVVLVARDAHPAVSALRPRRRGGP